ncbi:hypothetical protein ATANTOWER_002390 [Ataeniobius toweri]|uniref:Uncharacterized protein n=1 Tax=Ataeniobius toweri TaxID=208326 RepID=A0ABU7AIF2_9TELE|nr:hypothetical protein [Ataeniobius toweri]
MSIGGLWVLALSDMGADKHLAMREHETPPCLNSRNKALSIKSFDASSTGRLKPVLSASPLHPGLTFAMCLCVASNYLCGCSNFMKYLCKPCFSSSFMCFCADLQSNFFPFR